MGDQDSEDTTDRPSSSETEKEMERDEVREKDSKTNEPHPPSFSQFTSTVRAVIRIRQKYQALKKRRLEMAAVLEGPGDSLEKCVTGAPLRTSPKIFTFDGLTPFAINSLPQRKKRKKRSRVMYPSCRGRKAPPSQERNRAKYCLYLFCTVAFLQVYNAIENLDDHVLRYDLEGLEKTMRREVFGQLGAVETLLSHLRDYLSTYVHNKPLVLSLHGPSGVGKSHIGRLVAGHFRSVVGESLVLQYYVLHNCPLEADAWQCASSLSKSISRMVEQAEEEEKIPVFIFDEVEHMHREILDALRDLVVTQRSNEYLNAIYVFLSNLAQAHITKYLLHNSSSLSMEANAAGRHSNLVKELSPILRNSLKIHHPLWAEADLIPMTLLQKSHVMECFLDEMTREGFYPDQTNIERITGEIEYYPVVGEQEYARTGCKQVVAKVNLL